MSSQATFSNYQHKSPEPVPKPMHVLDWHEYSSQFRRFILLHTLNALDRNESPTFNDLVNEISQNMGKAQGMEVFVENLLYQGILEYSTNQKVRYTDLLWSELELTHKPSMELKRGQL